MMVIFAIGPKELLKPLVAEVHVFSFHAMPVVFAWNDIYE